MKITKEEIQKILYAFANMKIDKKSIEHKILYELLGNHPDATLKIGCGVDYFYVQQSKWKRNQYNFMIQRIDGSSTDFSFNKCLNPKRISSKNENWKSIFRNVVKDQTDSFRSSAFKIIGDKDTFTCSETNLKFKKIYSHVDHVYPLTFDSIMIEFIEINKLDLSEIKLSDDTGTSEVKTILDENIIKSFYDFHKNRSVLRIVCSSANLQAKKTKNYGGGNPDYLKKELLGKYPQYHIVNDQYEAQT
jgi:hypothetical protein